MIENEQYPTDGLYDVCVTLNTDGRLETSRQNVVPQTFEQACRWIRTLMRLKHKGVDGFAQVEDVNIARIPDAPYFADDTLRDLWLMERVQEMATRRQMRMDAEMAGERVIFFAAHGKHDRARREIQSYEALSAEVVCRFPEESVAMGIVGDRVMCAGWAFAEAR